MNNCSLEGLTVTLIDDSKIEQLGFSGNMIVGPHFFIIQQVSVCTSLRVEI